MAASFSGVTRTAARTCGCRTRTPSSPIAPIAYSGFDGEPSLRTRITSRGAPRARATSAATGTPPRGRPRTTVSWRPRVRIRSPSWTPASCRFRNTCPRYGGARSAGRGRARRGPPGSLGKVSGQAFIGISGWRYRGWRGDFYPKGLQQRRELGYAAERVGSVGINGSFYSLQRPSSYRAWAEQTPEGFQFAVKGGRYITHMLRLRNADAALGNFFASGVLALEQRLGPVLWQLPARERFDPEVLDAFLGRLPTTTAEAAEVGRRHDEKLKAEAELTVRSSRRIRHALEVRHDSFDTAECEEVLRRHGVALVVSDGAGSWPMIRRVVSADFVYVRLHGGDELYVSGYSPEELRAWAREVLGWLDGSGAPDGRPRDVYVYFDNDAKGFAPWDALELQRLVREGIGTPAG